MIDVIDNIFNNRVYDLVRNFAIAKHYDNAEMDFKLKDDPADMIYSTNGKRLYAVIDTGDKKSEMNMFEIAELNSLETLLFLPDEYISELKRQERFEESLFKNDYLEHLLDEYIQTYRNGNLKVVDSTADHKGDLLAEVSQLHLQIIGMAHPPEQFVKGLKYVVELINDKTADKRDISSLVAMLHVEHVKYQGLLNSK